MQSFILNLAAVFALIIGLSHSWLGERKLLRPLLSPERCGSFLAQNSFGRRILRGAWHLTSISWWGTAAILARLAVAPLDGLGIDILFIIGTSYLVSGLIVLVWLEGRHFAWPLFLAVAVCALGIAITSSGAESVAITVRVIGFVTAALLLAASALHAYWASGGRHLSGIAIPEQNGKPLFKPRPAGTWVISGALLLAGLILAARSELLPTSIPTTLLTIACWGLASVFLARAIGDFRFVGFFKRVHGSRFAHWDTALYSPLCLVIGLAIVALNVAGQ